MQFDHLSGSKRFGKHHRDQIVSPASQARPFKGLVMNEFDGMTIHIDLSDTQVPREFEKNRAFSATADEDFEPRFDIELSGRMDYCFDLVVGNLNLSTAILFPCNLSRCFRIRFFCD